MGQENGKAASEAMNNDSPCECKSPGFCQRYQIEQQEYPWQICQSNSDKGEAYRTKWAKDLVRRSQGGPGIVQKAINATKAVAKTAVNMFRMTPKEIQEERAAICDACEFNDKAKGICIHPRCGCNLKRGLVGGLVPSKLEIATERCPLGKWNSV